MIQIIFGYFALLHILYFAQVMAVLIITCFGIYDKENARNIYKDLIPLFPVWDLLIKPNIKKWK